MEGRQAVGHPVDVASGSVFTKRRDLELPGTVTLDWVRTYATDCEENSWLGRGWTVPFFMRLQHTIDGFLLIDEAGRPLLFPAPGGALATGESIVRLGANMELRRHAQFFEILHWHVATDDIERFIFFPSSDGIMPLAWVENLAGHRITIEYDVRRRPVRVRQELEQRVLELRYDANDLIIAVEFVDDGELRRPMVRYSYDSERRLVRSVDALGQECTYSYDEAHRLVGERNPLGSVFRFAYDWQGRCVYTSGEDRYLERSLQYLSAPTRTKVTDSLGNTTEYLLNAAGQVIQEISPLGAVTTTQYDEHGRITKMQYSDGAAIAYEFDERGNRKSVTDASGAVSVLEHNDLHLLTSFLDPTGSRWTFDYDVRGNLLAVTNPLGGRFECSRDQRGLVTQSRRPGGLVTNRAYGPGLRSIEFTDQISRVLRVDTDGLGRQTAVFDAKGLVRRVANDALGRPVQITDGQGRSTRLSYNANNDLVERVYAGNLWERWHYDRFGRVIAHENATGRLQLEYDTEDHLLAVVNRAGERLTRAYDADGRMVSQTLFDGRTERFDYNNRGFRTRWLKSDGRTVEVKYDAGGAIVARTSSDGLAEQFTYDPNGRLVKAENGDASVELERDSLGRVVAELQNGRRVEYGFDADNNRIRERIADIEGDAIAVRYDVRGRLVALEDAAGLFQQLTWDVTDQLLERRFAGGALERFTYDGARRLTRHEVASAVVGGVLQRRFQYDDRDNIVVREDVLAGRAELRYDGISRLVQVVSSGATESYDYDGAGTVLRTHRGPRTVLTGGRTQTDGARRFEYDDDGCVAVIEADEGRYELRHNVDGKLVAVTLPDGVEARYAYDALGRRIWKEVAGQRTEFVWASCDLAAELRPDSAPRRYFHHYQTPLAQWTGGRRQIPIVDDIGLPQALLDETGRPIWRPRWEAYGLLADEQGSGGVPFRFRGQYQDDETGFFYNYHRHYDPRLAGFLAPDPLGLTGGSNFYLYPRNPLLWDDPFGLTCSNKHKGQMGEAEMDAHYASLGYSKLGSHDAPFGGGPGRPQGIDGVYHNPTGSPPYIIAEAKYGSAGLGSTVHSGEQMSNMWVNSPIGGTGPNRLEQAVGPGHAAAIQASAAANPGSVQKQVFTLPAPGTPGTGSVTQTANYNPASMSNTF